MKNYLCSFLSRLALPGLMLLTLLSPAIARADQFAINVTIGGFKGTGSFNTDGTCDPCTAGIGQQLTNFTFTVDDDTFNEADAVTGTLIYERGLNLLTSGSPIPGGDPAGSALTFGLPLGPGLTTIIFNDTDDAPAAASGTATVAPVPEPTSLVLLGGVVCCLAFSLKRRFRQK